MLDRDHDACPMLDPRERRSHRLEDAHAHVVEDDAGAAICHGRLLFRCDEEQQLPQARHAEEKFAQDSGSATRHVIP
jgi:hypothetical protein